MRKLLFILVCSMVGFYAYAQDNQKINQIIFTDATFVEPNPPKPIKGWRMVGLEENVAALVGEYPGKIIKFQFKGNAVGIEVEATPEAGIIEYSIDASEWEKLDLYMPVSKEKQVPVYFTLGDNLKNRRHTLQLRLTENRNSESSGSKCTIRNFYFNSPQ